MGKSPARTTKEPTRTQTRNQQLKIWTSANWKATKKSAESGKITNNTDMRTRAYGNVDERPARSMWMKGLRGWCGCWIGLTADDAVALACLRDDGLRTPRDRGNNKQQRHQRKQNAEPEGQKRPCWRDPTEALKLNDSKNGITRTTTAQANVDWVFFELMFKRPSDEIQRVLN